MGDGELTPEERAAGLTAWSPDAAESFRAFAADMGFELDYSPESLSQVERLITEALSGRNGKPKRKYRELSGVTGAYVAEVILRNIGGEWGFEPEWEAGGIRLPSGMWVFPLHKAGKRYEDGPGDDFASYYMVVKRDASGQ
jgi:hypothetical protein